MDNTGAGSLKNIEIYFLSARVNAFFIFAVLLRRFFVPFILSKNAKGKEIL